MKLSRRTNPEIVIRVRGIPVVQVQPIRIEVTDIDEVAVRRAPSLLLFLYTSKDLLIL